MNSRCRITSVFLPSLTSLILQIEKQNLIQFQPDDAMRWWKREVISKGNLQRKHFSPEVNEKGRYKENLFVSLWIRKIIKCSRDAIKFNSISFFSLLFHKKASTVGGRQYRNNIYILFDWNFVLNVKRANLSQTRFDFFSSAFHTKKGKRETFTNQIIPKLVRFEENGILENGMH